MTDTAQLVLLELGRMALVLEDRVESPEAFVSWMVELGWDVPAVSASSLSDLASHISTLISLIEQVDSGDISEVEDAVLQQIAAEALAFITSVQDLPALFSGISVPAEFLNEAPEQIALSIFLSYLENNHPLVYAAFRAVGVITVIPKPAEGNRPSYEALEFSFEALGEFFNYPGNLYRWGTSDADLAGVRDTLQLLANAFGIPAYRQSPSAEQTEELYASLPAELDERTWELRIPLLEAVDEEIGYVTSGFAVLPLFDFNLATDGLAIVPFAEGELGLEISLGEQFVLRLDGGLAGSIRIEVRYGGSRIVVREDGSNFRGSGSVEIALKESGKPTIVFGERDESRLEIGGLSAGLKATTAAANVDAAITFTLQDGRLFVVVSKGDGFLQKIFGDLTLESVLELGIGWSTLDGFFFSGSAGFELTIPIHISLGPIKLESILVGLLFNREDAEIEARIGFTAGLELGPIAASINRVGILAQLSQKENGNFGPLNIGPLEFLPPTGAGLSISAGGIIGGGFLEFDDPNKRYAGILALSFGEIGLTAIGLITTRMPDGSEGFSLLVNLGVTFDPPIQLPYGFTLSGVGGLIGVNRTMEIEVLQRGIRNRTLDSILFPDPSTVIANASKIISDLRSAFPPSEGRFVVGPMVIFGWGTPNIVTAEIGIFLELPDPIRIVLMGQLAAVLPEEEHGLVVIHLDILGVLDFAKEELTFQASLYDSRVLTYSMFGDSAFLLGWGNDPRFGLSLGGFHPKFTPPPPPIIFADLKRLTICISKGESLQLSCRAYQALTPNSLQFGARVDLYASGGGAEVTGNVGFDTLINISPFSFEVWIRAGVDIRYKGASLMGVELSFLLAGPTPWLARGKAKIKMLFVSIKVGFKITWGEGETAKLPSVDPWDPLKEALATSGNWGSALPEGRTLVESLRDREEGAPEQIVIHPAGRIEVRQNIVPLGVGLNKAGNAPVKNHDFFDIVALEANSDKLEIDPVEEFFARGQYEELSGQQRLSVPSFEKMKGGVTNAVSETVRIEGTVESTPLRYESILIRPDRTSQRQEPKGTLQWEDGKFLAKANIRRKAIGRAGPRKRYGAIRTLPKVGVSEERYCIANAEDLTRATLSPQLMLDNYDMTRMAADQALEAQHELEPDQVGTLIVIPEYEVFEEAA